MSEERQDLGDLQPDRVFDGGDLDCGSGLVLLIRENMLQLPVGGVLEMRSRETTVRDELPPWCRMVGHSYLGAIEAADTVRYFLRRGEGASEQEALEADKERARDFEWRARVRASGQLESTVYCRNFSFRVGQTASFEAKDRHPSAVEYLLGALAADVGSALATNCARAGLEVDDIELSVKGRLDNVLAHLGLEEGDPSFALIELTGFVSSFEDEARVRAVWDETLGRSPLVATLKKAVELRTRLAMV